MGAWGTLRRPPPGNGPGLQRLTAGQGSALNWPRVPPEAPRPHALSPRPLATAVGGSGGSPHLPGSACWPAPSTPGTPDAQHSLGAPGGSVNGIWVIPSTPGHSSHWCCPRCWGSDRDLGGGWSPPAGAEGGSKRETSAAPRQGPAALPTPATPAPQAGGGAARVGAGLRRFQGSCSGLSEGA